ncbi:MAG: acyltransferase [Anaerolineales bacterium]
MKKSGFYIPELDSLRFFAFLLVLIHHAGYSALIDSWEVTAKYGWMGVDLFLCLSAFLFSRLLYTEYQATGTVRVRNFYIRRAFRIWPLYVLFFIIAVTLTVQTEGWSDSATMRAIGMLTFTDNFMAARWGYNNVILYVNHLWTISYEEQVYLVIPWILLFLYRRKTSTAGLILLSMGILGTFLRAFMIYRGTNHPDIWVLPFSHFDSVLGGIVIGLGILDKPLKKIPNLIWLALGVLALWQVTQLPNVQKIQWELMYTYPLVGIGTSLIIYSLTQGNLWAISPLFRNKQLAYLGKISYGLYVYHKLGIFLANRIVHQYIEPTRELVEPAAGLLLAFLITVAMSIISYEAFEKFFLRMKDRFAVVKSRPA